MAMINRLRSGAGMRINSSRLTALLAIFFVLINYPLAISLYGILLSIDNLHIGLISALAGLFFALFNLLVTFFVWPYIVKPVMIFMILLSAAAAYSMHFYGVVYDWRMIETFTETNVAEAQSYLNSSFMTWMVLTGVIPALFVGLVKINYAPPLRELFNKLMSIALSVAIIATVYVFYAIDVASIGRNNKTLDRQILPYYVIKSSIKYIDRSYFYSPPKFEYIAPNPLLKKTQKANFVVFVIGETARADHFPANGYPRMTTPNMIKNDMISLQNVESCGTLTAVSVPCMFSHMTRLNLDEQRVRYQENAVDILAKAGVGVQWNENDEGCKGVCERVPTLEVNRQNSAEFCPGEVCLDEALIANMDTQIATIMQDRSAGALFLHTQGSHGPTYFNRYTEATKVFTPDCARSDIQNCDHQALINAYDNTLVYSDYVIGKIIDKLKRYQQQYNVAVVYISDHGESLGEDGLYLHGAPYFIAPQAQTHVPWMVWLSKGFVEDNKINDQCLRASAKNDSFSHDNWFHSMLGLMNVSSKVYDPKLDIYAKCRFS